MHRRHVIVLAFFSAFLLSAAILSPYGLSAPSPGTTTRVSVDSAGNQGNGGSHDPAISAEGRYVAFSSGASDLVPGDTNGAWDVFVHDRQTEETSRVSVDSVGNQGNSHSEFPAISTDGRFVAFRSHASNLVPDDTNGAADVFLHDRQTGATTRVSVDSAGNQGNSGSDYPAVTGDGRYVAFSSAATNLVPVDTNGKGDVFVHDCLTGETTIASADSSGNQGNGHSFTASISGDGRYVAFASDATNLVLGDTNGTTDVFVYDGQTNAITRVSVDSGGNEGNGQSCVGSYQRDCLRISGDGRYVAFNSGASNLVPGDTNNRRDIFVHDRQTRGTMRVSVDSAGNQGNSSSDVPSISSDGRYVAFSSGATNLVPGGSLGNQVFVHDRLTGETTIESVDNGGNQGNNHSEVPAVSGEGRFVAFYSGATNLVAGDTNVAADVFVRDRDDFDGIAWEDDNCPVDYNPGQENSDSGPPPSGTGAIANGTGVPGHDATVPSGDSLGDLCDDDLDNDRIPKTSDSDPGGDITYDDDGDGETCFTPWLDADDDGPSWDANCNGVLDGFEATCPLAANPNGDDDSDGLLNTWEACKWGTDPNAVNSDGDALGDCVEAADVNGDAVVDFIGDTIFYVKAALLPPDAFGKDGDFDINGDGVVDFVGDVIQEAKFALIEGLCK